MHDKFSSAMRAYTVGLLTLIWSANYLDRQIFAILLQSIKVEMALSDTQLGLVSGLAFALFYTTFGLPLAYLADRANRKRLIIASLSLFSVMTYACGLAQNFWHLLLARMGVGIGEAGTNPASIAMISDMYPADRRATPMAFFALGLNIGIFAAFFFGGWLAQNYGWRATFQIVAVPGLVLAVLAGLTMREPARGLSDQKGDAARKPPPAPPVKEVVIFMFQARAMRHMVAALALVFAVSYGAIAWIPAHLIRVHAMSTTDIGMALALIIGVGGGIGTAACGVLADRLAKRDMRWNFWLLGLVAIVTAPFLVLAFNAPTAFWALVFLVPGISLNAVYLGPALAMLQGMVKAEMRALASAVMMFVGNLIGLGLGPLIVGLVSDHLADSHGVRSLSVGLTLLAGLSIWSGGHFFTAARTLRQDLARAG